jgi:hypothetical protein
MLKTLITGAALGYLGKKLYDEGSLDPYISRAKEKLAELRAERERQQNLHSTSVSPMPATAGVRSTTPPTAPSVAH